MKKIGMIVLAICLAGCMFGCGSKKVNGTFTEITASECAEKFVNEETFIMVVTQTTCEMCKEYKEMIREYIKENKVDIVYIEADKDLDAFDRTWETYFPEVTDTPTTMMIVNGEVEDMVVGSLSADQFTLLLKRNNMGKGSLAEISYQKAKEWFDEERSFVMMVSQTTCSVCKAYKETLKEFIKEYDLDLVYVEADRDFDQFTEVLWDAYLPGVEETPTTCIVVNGEIVDQVVGDLNEEQLLKLLNRHGIDVE